MCVFFRSILSGLLFSVTLEDGMTLRAADLPDLTADDMPDISDIISPDGTPYEVAAAAASDAHRYKMALGVVFQEYVRLEETSFVARAILDAQQAMYPGRHKPRTII